MLACGDKDSVEWNIDDVTPRLANKMLAPCVGLRSEGQRGVGILMTSQQDWPIRCSLILILLFATKNLE